MLAERVPLLTERLALDVERLHDFSVALIGGLAGAAGSVARIGGPPFRGAGHGVDAVPDDADLPEAGEYGRGEGGDLELGHGLSPGERWRRHRGGVERFRLPAHCPRRGTSTAIQWRRLHTT